VAEDLAHSAALAVDNARSFRAAQEEIERRQQTEQKLRTHQDEIESLNSRLRTSVEVTHHHVRNNLQIILALTQLPVEEGIDTVPTSALWRIEHHTTSLAAMHDLLMERARIDAEVDHLSVAIALEKLVPLLTATSQGREITLLDGRYRLDSPGDRQSLYSRKRVDYQCNSQWQRCHPPYDNSEEGPRQIGSVRRGTGVSSGFDWKAATGTGLCLIRYCREARS